MAIKAKAKARVAANLAVTIRWRKGIGKSNTGASSSSASAPASAPPSNTTAHGVTSQHGPRFKRTRFGAPHEVKMVEEIHQWSSAGDEVDDQIGMGLDFDTVVAEVLIVKASTGARGQWSNVDCGWNEVLEALAWSAMDSSSRGRNQV